MFKQIAVGIAALLTGSFASAGTPVVGEVACPVGGETIETVSTMSCSVFPERNMSLAPSSSCDFVTRLPECPGNGLPLFREFSETDVAALSELIKTPEFGALRDKSRYRRAVFLARKLGDTADQITGIFLHGLWYDDETFFADATFRDAFVAHLSLENLSTETPNDAYLLAIGAYVAAMAGDATTARQRLADIRTGFMDRSAHLDAYIDAVSACVDTPKATACHFRSPFKHDVE